MLYKGLGAGSPAILMGCQIYHFMPPTPSHTFLSH